jgi:hypothetical protein
VTIARFSEAIRSCCGEYGAGGKTRTEVIAELRAFDPWFQQPEIEPLLRGVLLEYFGVHEPWDREGIIIPWDGPLPDDPRLPSIAARPETPS